MNQDRVTTERARRILFDWLELKGIEVDGTVLRKTRDATRVAFKLEVNISGSVMTKLKSELDFQNALATATESMDKWHKQHPDASEEQVSEWRDNFVVWAAEDFKINKDKLREAMVDGLADKQVLNSNCETVLEPTVLVNET